MLLGGAENVDGERLGLSEDLVGCSRATDAKQEQRRTQGHRGERVGREAAEVGTVARGDDGHARGIVAESPSDPVGRAQAIPPEYNSSYLNSNNTMPEQVYF